jgi:hypothetical protein
VDLIDPIGVREEPQALQQPLTHRPFLRIVKKTLQSQLQNNKPSIPYFQKTIHSPIMRKGTENFPNPLLPKFFVSNGFLEFEKHGRIHYN